MFKIVQILTISISQGKVILIWKQCIIYIEHRRLKTVQNRSKLKKKSPCRKGSKCKLRQILIKKKYFAKTWWLRTIRFMDFKTRHQIMPMTILCLAKLITFLVSLQSKSYHQSFPDEIQTTIEFETFRTFWPLLKNIFLRQCVI